MPTRQTVFRCLIISPGDVTAARDTLEAVIGEWNAHVGATLGARIEAVRWETHAAPEMGDRPQAIINKQLVDTCDLGIAIFWSRVGTPTGTHDSGSVEEIERLLSRNAPVSVYFCEADVPQSTMRDDQFARLQAVRERYQSMGLLGTYTDTERLARSFQLHLTRRVAQLLQRDEAAAEARVQSAGNAPRPDIRVKVARVFLFAFAPRRSTEPHVQVRIENHSAADFFFQSLFFQLSNGGSLWPHSDAVGNLNRPCMIRPGDSITFAVEAAKLLAQASEVNAQITHALVRDKIAREYLSPDGDMERALG